MGGHNQFQPSNNREQAAPRFCLLTACRSDDVLEAISTYLEVPCDGIIGKYLIRMAIHMMKRLKRSTNRGLVGSAQGFLVT